MSAQWYSYCALNRIISYNMSFVNTDIEVSHIAIEVLRSALPGLLLLGHGHFDNSSRFVYTRLVQLCRRLGGPGGWAATPPELGR